jgi:hypothetical protein
VSYDDDYDRQQQRRDEERREQLREEQRREERREEQRRADERQAEYAREDAEIRRKQNAEEHERLMKDVRDRNMEGAFARIGVPFPGSSGADPVAPSQATGQPQFYQDPRGQAEALRQEMAGVLQGIINDRGLSDKDRQFFAAINEASYLDKIKPCLLAQIEQLTREIADMPNRRLAYDPLGLQAQVQSQRLQEIEDTRQAIDQELRWLTERRELLKQQANEIVYGNPQGPPNSALP